MQSVWVVSQGPDRTEKDSISGRANGRFPHGTSLQEIWNLHSPPGQGRSLRRPQGTLQGGLPAGRSFHMGHVSPQVVREDPDSQAGSLRQVWEQTEAGDVGKAGLRRWRITPQIKCNLLYVSRDNFLGEQLGGGTAVQQKEPGQLYKAVWIPYPRKIRLLGVLPQLSLLPPLPLDPRGALSSLAQMQMKPI